jgi:cysteine-rich repeat protein
VPDTLGTLACAAGCAAFEPAGCVPIVLNESEPNDDTATANAYVDPFLGRLESADDVDCVTVPGALAGDLVTAAILDFDDGRCFDTFELDQDISVFAANGALIAEASFFGCSSVFEETVPVDGALTVCTSTQAFNAASPGYRLQVTLRTPVCGDDVAEGLELCDGSDLGGERCFTQIADTTGLLGCTACSALDTSTCTPLIYDEIEPNNTAATAQVSDGGPFLGKISPADDVDCVQVNAVEADRIVAFVTDTGDNACTTGGMDSIVRIFDPAGDEVALNDDIAGAANRCSRAAFAAVTAGVHAVCVSAFGENGTFPYSLQAQVQLPVCGDGFIDPGEACDDGNLDFGDGCGGNCFLEVCNSVATAVLGDNLGDNTTGPAASQPENCLGAPGREQAWQFTPEFTGTLTASLVFGAGHDGVITVRTDCNNPDAEITCKDSQGSGGNSRETVSFAVDAFVPVSIIVDSFFLDDFGPYTLTLTQGAP